MFLAEKLWSEAGTHEGTCISVSYSILSVETKVQKRWLCYCCQSLHTLHSLHKIITQSLHRVLKSTICIFSISSPGYQHFFPWMLTVVSSELTLFQKSSPLGKALCLNLWPDLKKIDCTWVSFHPNISHLRC